MEIQLPLILDGATGTELQKRGFTGDISAEQWVLEHPESITAVQKGYVAAGSKVLYSPTFGANRKKLEEHGLFNKADEYNRKLAALSQAAADGKAYVAGDISPTGMMLAPLGEVSFEDLVDIYTEQAAALEAAGVDLFVIETMMTLSDARAAVLAVRSISDKPIFVTFTCDESGHSLSGTDVTAALAVLQGMGISAFGLNCSAGPEDMLTQLKRLQPFARVPLIAKPNAGLPEIVDGKVVYNCTPDEFVQWIPDMLEAGVAVFGGCCGTTAAHIDALQHALKGAKINPPNPSFTDLLPAATEKVPMYLPADAVHGAVLQVTDALGDEIIEVNGSDEAMIAIAVKDWDDIDLFIDNQYLIAKPLCLVCDDAEILEAALRAFQGRALYEGTLSEDVLAPLVDKYGLII